MARLNLSEVKPRSGPYSPWPAAEPATQRLNKSSGTRPRVSFADPQEWVAA
jgi:hypothetical protein